MRVVHVVPVAEDPPPPRSVQIREDVTKARSVDAVAQDLDGAVDGMVIECAHPSVQTRAWHTGAVTIMAEQHAGLRVRRLLAHHLEPVDAGGTADNVVH